MTNSRTGNCSLKEIRKLFLLGLVLVLCLLKLWSKHVKYTDLCYRGTSSFYGNEDANTMNHVLTSKVHGAIRKCIQTQ